jgi:formylglycine-generating enzyme required for sulfatase activity
MTQAGASDVKLKVFISYSRKDAEFAEELLAGLELAGFEPYLDKHDIAAGEDWEARLGRLIEAADTVVFVISPDAVASERCAWEVERTVTLKKRLLPIVWRRVEEAQVPPRLKQLNYIFFDKPLMSVPSLTALSAALRTDLGWIREHTRIGEAALRWNGRGRNEALLFRGDELAAAKTWLANPPQHAPEPTLLHHEFIKGGEDAEAARSTAERKSIEDMRAALDREIAAQAERETALNDLARAVRRGQRALAGAAGLFACIIVGAIGWYKQDYLWDVYVWRFRMGPSVLTASQAQDKAAKPGSDFKECAAGCPTMIVMPAGKLIMGSPDSAEDRIDDEGPQRQVMIPNSFAVGKTEVTFEEYDACVSAGACQEPPDSGWGRGDRPVINVSWEDAKTYTTWLSRMTGKDYRLLTEAEWEYAARAGSTTAYSWGNEVGEGNANCSGCKSHWDGKQTAPVGSFKPNAFGLSDMHGNVWEWMQDCHDVYSKAPNDGTAAKERSKCNRVLRGGSWRMAPNLMRAAVRYDYLPIGRIHFVGFRVARVLSPARTP